MPAKGQGTGDSDAREDSGLCLPADSGKGGMLRKDLLSAEKKQVHGYFVQNQDASGHLGESYSGKLEHFETNPSQKFPEQRLDTRQPSE